MNDERYASTKNTVCFGDLKHASLYFDRVIPVNSFELIDYENDPLLSDKDEFVDDTQFVSSTEKLMEHWENRNINGLIKHKALVENLVFGDAKVDNIDSFIASLDGASYSLHLPAISRAPQIFYSPGYTMLRRHEPLQLYAYLAYIKRATKIGETISVAAPLERLISQISWGANSVSAPPGLPKIDISLSNTYEIFINGLNLIDTNDLSWEEILDIRRDPVSRERLRRFRTYFFESHDGKDADYIKDKILRSLDEYEHECKIRNKKTRTVAITQIFATDLTLYTALGSGAIALLSALTNGTIPVAAEMLAALPAIQKIGSVFLECRKSTSDASDFRDRHDLAYLLDLKDQAK